jgi:hypothetical protein
MIPIIKDVIFFDNSALVRMLEPELWAEIQEILDPSVRELLYQLILFIAHNL